jgi:HicA-like toxin of HicAB toxin-antitoxin system
MSLRELQALLLDLGCTFHREGKSHEIWRTLTGEPISIPRHRKVNPGLAKWIRNQARRGANHV